MKRVVPWIAVSAVALLWTLVPAAALEGWNFDDPTDWPIPSSCHTGHQTLPATGSVCMASDDLGGVGLAYLKYSSVIGKWEVWYKHSSGTASKLGDMPTPDDVIGGTYNDLKSGPLCPAISISFVADIFGESLNKAVVAVAAGYAKEVSSTTIRAAQVVRLFAYDHANNAPIDYGFTALDSEEYGPEQGGAVGWTIQSVPFAVLNHFSSCTVAVGAAGDWDNVSIAVKEQKDSDVLLNGVWYDHASSYSIMKGCSVDHDTGQDTNLWCTPNEGKFNPGKIDIRKPSSFFGDDVHLAWVAGGYLYYLDQSATDPSELTSGEWSGETPFAGSGEIVNFWMERDGDMGFPYFAWKSVGPNNTTGCSQRYLGSNYVWVTETLLPLGLHTWRLNGFDLNQNYLMGDGKENYLLVRADDSEHDAVGGDKFCWERSSLTVPEDPEEISQWVAPAGDSPGTFQNAIQVSDDNVYVVTMAAMETAPYEELVIRKKP